MEKIPQKGIIKVSPATPNKGVVLGVPQKKQDPEKSKKELSKEHLPVTNKVLEPTMSMASIPVFRLNHEPITQNTHIPVKKELAVKIVSETPIPNPNKIPKEKPIGDISDIQNIRTYKKDVANTITNQKTSLVRMVLEEQKGRQKRERDESPRTRKNFSLIIFSIIFFLATLSIVYYAFFRTVNTDNLLTEINITQFINTEVSQEFSIDGKSKKEIVKEIQQEITGTNSQINTAKNIFFTKTLSSQTPDGATINKKKIVTVSELFEKIEVSAPSVILRTIKNDFMFGYHSFNGNQPFLILKTDYYDNTFSGMLIWENTMSLDLIPLFGTIGKEDLIGRTWSDIITKNKDTRILSNFDGSVALVYMFKDKETLIITTNNNTLFEISQRLDLSVKKSGI